MTKATRSLSAFTPQSSLFDISTPLQLLANLYRKGGISIHMAANMHKTDRQEAMSTMNISLPDALKLFVDEQVSSRSFETSSECVRELIRKDQERLQLRGLLLAGASTKPAGVADGAYFSALRNKIGNVPRQTCR